MLATRKWGGVSLMRMYLYVHAHGTKKSDDISLTVFSGWSNHETPPERAW